MKNVHRAGIVLAAAAVVAVGVGGNASAGPDADSSVAMSLAAKAPAADAPDGAPQRWPVAVARIAYIGAKQAASTPAVRSQAAQVARAAGIFAAPPAKVAPSAATVDVVFDR